MTFLSFSYQLPNPLRLNDSGTSLAVQWLGLCTSTAGGTGSIPGRGTKFSHAEQRGQKEKKKKLNDREDFKPVSIAG